MAGSKKNSAGGYTITAANRPDPARVLGTLARIAGERFNQRVEIVNIRVKDDPNDTRMFAPLGRSGT